MLETRARRIPLVDVDDDTKRPMVCSVITQYRILKFISVNVTDTQLLRKPLRQIKIGTSRNLEVCKMDTPVINVINQMVRRNISCVPMVNSVGTGVFYFSSTAHGTNAGGRRGGERLRGRRCHHPHQREQLRRPDNFGWRSIAEAASREFNRVFNPVANPRLTTPLQDFPGIYTCSPDDRLDTIFDTLRKSRVHRFIIIDTHSRLVGILSLSDILEYALLNADGDEPRR
jgi:5'-AMP-activated protein kinase, regulatory gamma subunit